MFLKPSTVRILVILAVFSLLIMGISAQESTTNISISIPQINENLFKEVISEFESQYPDIHVDIIASPFDFTSDPPANIEEELDRALQEVSKADVILLDDSSLSVEITRAGYLLDMTPLVQVDSSLNEFDFYDAFWNSFQWDNGVWALPYDGDVSVILYDPTAFDEVGAFYPESGWNLLDVEQALRDLTEYDDDGKVTASAIFDATDNNAIYAMMIGLLGHGIYDELSFPSVPRFNDPLLGELITIWAEVQKDGLLGVDTNGFNAPILIVPSLLATIPAIGDGYELSLLPGGRSNISVSGAAISAGSRNPDAAYELVKFLTFSETLAQESDNIPARRSLAEAQGLAFQDFSQEEAELVMQALENALPAAEMRFTSYIEDAVTQMVLRDIDAPTALNEVELEALDRLQVASNRADSANIIIQGKQEIVLAPGEIALNFGISSIFSPLPTQERWDQVVTDFVEFDPEVGHVTLDVQQGLFDIQLADIAAEYDCFYLPDNEVQSADLSLLLSLNPLISADPFFDPNDFVGNVLTQVQRNEQTWAIPLVIQPEVMFYDTDIFNQNGAVFPSNGWSVPEFEDALYALKVRVDDPPPFVPRNFGGTYVLVLVAAYGGLPVDYRTVPPTLYFDDPAVVEAARQVLDLAKEGYIKYDGLTQNLGFNFFNQNNTEVIAILNRFLNPISDFLPGNVEKETLRLITFPQGAQLNAVSYDMGTVYISANTQYAEACYRFISQLSNTPDLFDEMPARRSHLNSRILAESQGEGAVEFYRSLDQLMQQPTTVLIPTPLSLGIESAGTFLATLWMNRAFDRYVFEDADLELELQDAQQFATEFLACTDELPAYNATEDDFQDFAQQILGCATDVDPTFSELLGF